MVAAESRIRQLKTELEQVSEKVREDERVESMAVVIATGVLTVLVWVIGLAAG